MPFREWLEADGLGGFASGVDAGPRTRRYHALLLSARRPPVDRFVLVNGVEAWLEYDGSSFPLSTQKYLPNVVHPDGHRRLESFTAQPWPTWRFRTEPGVLVQHEVVAVRGRAITLLRWSASAKARGVRLVVRPLLSGRDYHALHRENGTFNFNAGPLDGGVRWQPYEGVPAISAYFNGAYTQDPQWFRNFLYEEERARGLDHVEDLASPGVITFDLFEGPAQLAFTSEESPSKIDFQSLFEKEARRRAAISDPMARSADAYVVRRGAGKTIVAGYPWFTDWGRDSFIAIRGLCLALGRLDDAEGILLEWCDTLTEGMLPNRFTDDGEKAEFNSVDASLWFIVAVHDFLRTCKLKGRAVDPSRRKRLEESCETIVASYRKGVRYGIKMSFDGLLECGVPGSQITWMDAKFGDTVVTPRIGKPVEVQALWLAATFYVSSYASAWTNVYDRALASFRQRFWNPAADGLFDVVDVNHELNVNDASFRPNQLFAVGGLPWTFLELDRARKMVDAVERRLLTRIGLRTLAPDEPGYRGRYEGSPEQRDSAYHQGTVWPWLMGPFIEAWVRARGDDARVRREAREKFLKPFLEQLSDSGIGHISEIADGDYPHLPRGCPFQAWSLAEALRLDRVVLA